MKKTLLLFIIFPFLNFNAQEEMFSTVTCKYLLVSLLDTTDVNSKFEEITTLQIGDNVSLFRSEKKYLSDSLSMVIADRSFDEAKGGVVKLNLKDVPKSKYKSEVLRVNDDVKVYSNLLNNYFHFSPKNLCKWEIDNETKVISGYNCRKASGIYGNKILTAWFTYDVPFPEGPYNFKGLPGLIVEVYDDKGYNHFVLVSLKNVKSTLNPIERSIETTFEKFDKKRKEVMADPFSHFKNRITNIDNKYAETINKNARKRNNFID